MAHSPRAGVRESVLEARLLAGLLVLLPFEPRRPAVHVLGLQVTLLEAAAGVAGAALLWLSRRRLLVLLRRPPLPLVFIALYAAAHALAASLAPAHSDLAARFAARMAAMAGFAWVVAAAPPRAHRAGLLALGASACAVAALAVLEGLGVGGLDPLLDRFREMPVTVAGVRRASAGSEHPNLAAGFLAYGLQAAVGLAAAMPHPVRLALPLSALLSTGLLYTFSRGALAAAGAGLLALAVALSWRGGRPARAPLAALGVLLGAGLAVAWTGEVFRLRLGPGAESWYGAVYEPAETPLRLRPGEVRTTPVRVTNSGRRTWATADEFRLSYHWYAAGWSRLVDGGRTPLSRALGPGESDVLQPAVRAPEQQGHYVLVWDMIHEPSTWFSGQGVRPAAVPALVTAVARDHDSAPAEIPEVGWQPGRGELWRLALQMWREHPWTGVGSDNFRWLYGPRAGRPFWDSRIFANNTLLEAAATTGAVGLAALVGTFATTAVRIARRARKAGRGAGDAAVTAILFALTAAMLVHGMVDYVLAFTGHYLMLGFLVGAVSAPGGAET